MTYKKLTVAELIQLLIKYPPEMQVYRADDNYGELPVGTAFLSIEMFPTKDSIPVVVLEVFNEE